MLEKNKSKLTELAEVLLDKEVIFKDNLEKIFGKRPFTKEPVEPSSAEKKTTSKLINTEETQTKESSCEEE